jgi:hypothetical protein
MARSPAGQVVPVSTLPTQRPASRRPFVFPDAPCPRRRPPRPKTLPRCQLFTAVGSDTCIHHAAYYQTRLVGAITPSMVRPPNNHCVARPQKHPINIGDKIHFAHDAGKAIERICSMHVRRSKIRPHRRSWPAHLADQPAYLQRHSRPTPTRPRLPTPVRSEPGAVPTDNGFRLHDRQRIANFRE